MVNVICMKWGNKYDAEYVNVLRSMVARRLTLEHRFVCLTDNGQGIDPKVEVFPIPDLGLPPNTPERGWNKLVTFKPGLGSLKGLTLFLDLDLVLIGNIDCFFEHPGDYCIIRNWPPPLKRTGNSSVYRFDMENSAHLYEDFIRNHADIRKRFRNDQEYLTHAMGESGTLHYWPDEWCRSFKRHCIPTGPMRFFKKPVLPAGTKILVFHGTPKPDQAIDGYRGSLRRFTRPAAWIDDYWR